MKFTNRIIALLLSIVMISAVACLSVSAITLFPVADWVYHKINNDKEFEIYDYIGEQKSIFTPYSHNSIYITTVGANAFDGNTTMESLTLSKYITTVSHHAFLNCTSLKTVDFQGVSVKTIDDYAFAGCSSLSGIALENTLIDTLSCGVFMNCDSLTEITVPDTVTTIEEKAFAYCDKLSKVVIPETVTAIDGNAFEGSDNVVIYCYEDSLAHRYAVNNEIEFVLLDPKQTYILGDVDNNGKVTILDATVLQCVLVFKMEKPENFDLVADTNQSGYVSILDATHIQFYMADLLDDSPIGKTFEY